MPQLASGMLRLCEGLRDDVMCCVLGEVKPKTTRPQRASPQKKRQMCRPWGKTRPTHTDSQRACLMPTLYNVSH